MTNVALSAYRKLPLGLRDRLRWIRFPRHFAMLGVLWHSSHGRVASGPFVGMRWRKANPHIAYLLGTQELELHETIEAFIAAQFPDFVNVGAADGFYAVGMALRCPKMRVLAFEADDEHRGELLEVARLNGVGSAIAVSGYCTAQSLQEALATRPNALVLVDIEGGEIEVVDPVAAPLLRNATILVETHDGLRPGCAAAMRERFAGSHRIEVIETRDRVLSDLPKTLAPWLTRLSPRHMLEYANEHRGIRQEWFIMSPINPALG